MYAISGGLLQSGESVLFSPDAIFNGQYVVHSDDVFDKMYAKGSSQKNKIKPQVIRSLVEWYAWALMQTEHSFFISFALAVFWRIHSGTTFFDTNAVFALTPLRRLGDTICRYLGRLICLVLRHRSQSSSRWNAFFFLYHISIVHDMHDFFEKQNCCFKVDHQI